MTKKEFEAKAFEAKARSLRLAFEHASARCALHIQHAAPLPHGPARTEMLARARDELRAARAAIQERAAFSKTLHRDSIAPPAEQDPFESAVARLETLLEQLSPSREA